MEKGTKIGQKQTQKTKQTAPLHHIQLRAIYFSLFHFLAPRCHRSARTKGITCSLWAAAADVTDAGGGATEEDSEVGE